MCGFIYVERGGDWGVVYIQASLTHARTISSLLHLMVAMRVLLSHGAQQPRRTTQQPHPHRTTTTAHNTADAPPPFTKCSRNPLNKAGVLWKHGRELCRKQRLCVQAMASPRWSARQHQKRKSCFFVLQTCLHHFVYSSIPIMLVTIERVLLASGTDQTNGISRKPSNA